MIKDFIATMGGTAIISSLALSGGHPLLIVLGYAVGACSVLMVVKLLAYKKNKTVLIKHD